MLGKEQIKARIKDFIKSVEVGFKKFLVAPYIAYCGRVPTTELVRSIFNFCELYSGLSFYPYQEQFSKRVIR